MNPTHTAIASPTAEMERLLGDFLAYMELERGLSRNTLDAYRSDLLQFAAFLHRRRLSATEATRAIANARME